MFHRSILPWACALSLAATLLARATADDASLTAIPVGRFDYQIWDGQRQLFDIQTRLLGDGWKQPQFTKLPASENGTRVFADSAKFGDDATVLDFGYAARPVGDRALEVTTTTSAGQDAKATGAAFIVQTTDFLAGGTGVATFADGSAKEFNLPVGQANFGNDVKEVVLTASSGEVFRITPNRPLALTADRGELRLWFWQNTLVAENPQTATVSIAFPRPVRIETANRFVDTSGWIKFQPRQDFKPGSPIGAEPWLDAPAGKHGWVQMDGQHFVFEKKKDPIKFWGTNIAYAAMAVPDNEAIQWAEKFAKYGVNIVRFHKWTGNLGWDGVMSRDDAMEFDPASSRQFDFIHNEFKKRGIYAGWSPIFALKLHDSMAKYIPHFQEIKDAVPKTSGLFKNTLYPIQNISTEVQDYYIAMTVKWLNRKNEFTGLRYADDPAVAYVELHNEADIFFPGTGAMLQRYPTYQKQMEEKFADWLSKRYADDAALAAAWGKSLRKDESLSAKNIFPFPKYGGENPAPRRVVDSYMFLYDFQNSFYERYVQAIRATGYKGAIVGGCWQTADMYGHLLNIASDRKIGFIDRHNYFRGSRTMLADPGSALLSAGMQQVADRPFGLTEWAADHAWHSECQPILGLVGLGLNGWDYSAQFASGNPVVLPDNAAGINANFDELTGTGQHPFIARLLYSGALKEGPVVGERRISMQELENGQIGFKENFSLLGGANLKNFVGAVPNEALGAGRVTLNYVPEPVEPKVLTPELEKYWDKSRRIIRSGNGQIVWDYSGQGFFTVDTPVGQALIGFGGGTSHDLSEVSIRSENAYANIYFVASDPGQTLAKARRVIIHTLGRTANRGDVIEETNMVPVMREEAPQQGNRLQKLKAILDNPRMLVEPVKATFTVKRKDPFKVYALDHDGCLPADAKPLPVTSSTAEGQQFTLDGAQTGAFYYLLEFGS